MTLELKKIREIEHTAPVCACVFERSGRYVFAGAWERSLLRWDLRDGTKTSFAGPQSWILSLQVPPSNRFLYTTDHVGELSCWSLADAVPRQTWSVAAHRGTATSVAVSKDEGLLATGGADGRVRLWHAQDGRPLRQFDGFTDIVEAVAFHPDGKQLLATGRDCVVRGWSLETGNETLSYPLDGLKAFNVTQGVQYGGGRHIAFRADGKVLACCGRAGYARPASVLLFDVASGKQTQQLVATLADSVYYTAQFHPGGHLLALGSSVGSGELGVWLPGQDKQVTTATLSGPGFDFALSPDARQVVVAQTKAGKGLYPERGSLVLYELSIR